MIEEERLLLNPFPGLRPFRYDECECFFGRDGQSDQVLSKLGATRFVAVVGTSGSGKSSLVSAGLLPALRSGHLPSAGSSWRIASFRPGSDPIKNLAAVLSSGEVSGAQDETIALDRAESIERTLRRSSLGLLEVVREFRMKPAENLLILADQFEELFRFRKKSTAEHPQDEAAAFVKLLLEARQTETPNESKLPIYVILTMRSDYLGDCAHFWGLPEAINEGQFLIPRMTDDDRREAIIGPVMLAGAEITPTLVNLLLNDAGDDPAQLPILQHALARTWSYWKERGNAEGPIDLEHYVAIGGMAEALSNHANEALAEVVADPDLRPIPSKLFKALTEKEADSREGRRPATISEIAIAAEVSEQQVIEVVEAFRREDRSFLMPAPPAKLKSDTLIDISHESLIRGWDMLRKWVDEEAAAARQYIVLADRAALYPDQESCLRDPALSNALKWLEDNRPTKAWAERYHPGFDKTVEYIELSKKQRAEEIAEREERHRTQVETDLRHAEAMALQQRLRVRQLRWGLVLLSLLLIGMFGATVFAWQQKRVAQTQTIRAERAAKEAELQRDVARKSKTDADSQKAIAVNALDRAERERDKLLIAEAETARQRDRAEKKSAEALKQERLAKAATLEAERQKAVAEAALREESLARVSADRAEKAALNDKKEAERQRDNAAELLRTVNEIDRSAPYFRAVIRGHKEPITRAWIAGNENVLYTVSSDRSAQMWDTRTAVPDLASQPYLADPYSTPVLYSRDGKLALLNKNPGHAGAVLWDIPGRKQLVELPWTDANAENTIMSPDGQTILHYEQSSNHMYAYRAGEELQVGTANEPKLPYTVFSPDSSLLAHLSSNNSAAAIWQVNTRKAVSDLIGHLDQINSIAFSHDSRFVVTSSKDRTAKVWDAKTGNELAQLSGQGPVNSARFSDDGRYIVTTSGKNAYLWEAKSPDTWKEITDSSPTTFVGHTSPVTDAAFTPDGKWVVTISEDRTAQLWDAKVIRGELNKNTTSASPREWSATSGAPTVTQSLAVFRGHIKALTSIDFSPDSKYLVTGSEDRTARVWDLRSFGEFNVADVSVAPSAPEYGGNCPANVKVTGKISVAGRSGSVEFKFVRSDGSESLPQTLTFDGPGVKEVTDAKDIYTEGVNRSGNPIPVRGWVEIEILKPVSLKSNRATFSVSCGQLNLQFLTKRKLSQAELQQIMPAASEANRTLYLPHLQRAMDEFGINTPLRQAAFLAEVAHNSAQLSHLVEIGNDSKLEELYGLNSRLGKGLGNVEPGDGARFRGRGAFQIIGRSQYQTLGAALGVDLVAEPDKAASPEVAFRTAALYWQKNGLNDKADKSLLADVHRRVQGGLQSLQEVQKIYDTAKRVLSAE